MSLKALSIGFGGGLAIYAVLYAINGWQAMLAGFGISALIMGYFMWSER